MNIKYQKSACLSRKDKEKMIKEELDKQSRDIVPAVYSSIALALFEGYGWQFEDINSLFAYSQQLWDDLGDENMIAMCEERTGILLKGE